MITNVKTPTILAIGGLKKMKDGVLSPYLDATVKGLKANVAIYPKPPIDLITYGNEISAYDNSITATLDGSKTAIAQKNKLKAGAIKLYGQMAKYVEANCNDDLATFLLSGFQPRSSIRTKTPAASSAIRKLRHGANSGEIDATLIRVVDAASYEIRSAPVPQGGTPGAWTIIPAAKVKSPTKITGLAPGTLYAFQARALLKTSRYTDWSDSITLMCI